MTLQTTSGKTATLLLSSHEMETNIQDFSEHQLRAALEKNVKLRRLEDGLKGAVGYPHPTALLVCLVGLFVYACRCSSVHVILGHHSRLRVKL